MGAPPTNCQRKVQAAVLLLEGQHRAGIGDGGVDLQAVAHDAGVGQQARAIGVVKGGDAGVSKAAKARR